MTHIVIVYKSATPQIFNQGTSARTIKFITLSIQFTEAIVLILIDTTGFFLKTGFCR